jgi:hypothetical protein
MPEKTAIQQVLDQVSTLTLSLANHMAGQTHTDQMTAAMYKLLITGNGNPPLPEIVHKHERWLEELRQDKCNDVEEIKKEEIVARSDARSDRREVITSNRQFWIMLASQLIGFILLGLAVVLRWK